jgi:hypothetical protein
VRPFAYPAIGRIQFSVGGDLIARPNANTLKIAVAYVEKIIALKYAARRYPVAHENAEDLAADFIVGRSVKHGHLRSGDAFSNIKPQRACRTAAAMN